MADKELKFLVVDDFTPVDTATPGDKPAKVVVTYPGFNNVEEAEDDQEIQEHVKKETSSEENTQKGGYGFVISDWNMPNMDATEYTTGADGIITITGLKEGDGAMSALPVLMVTAEAKPEHVSAPAVPVTTTSTATDSAGASGYVVKPFTTVSDLFSDGNNNSSSSKTESMSALPVLMVTADYKDDDDK